jgi:hypothetical protein
MLGKRSTTELHHTPFYIFILYFETESHLVAQASFELAILLP